MMNFEEIKKYWEDRATGDSSAQSTTQDIYLREIEFNVIADRLQRYSPNFVADVGCGDGRTTLRLANRYPNSSFSGFDYSSAMVENAQLVLNTDPVSNIKFVQLDICEGLKDSFNLIYTTRCLINLPSWDLQKVALKNIQQALTPGGVYLMVENFVDGQANFNQIRKNFDLSEVPIRGHNFFFERERLHDYVDGMFRIEEEVNISSSYYLVSRVIYSKICAEKGIQPDYFDDHHRFAASLPFSGEFGPIRLICLKKR
jgi:ubiquinone/menaquinone biosynthesis C-methylase UbiE